jgi:hypothetical protein
METRGKYIVFGISILVEYLWMDFVKWLMDLQNYIFPVLYGCESWSDTYVLIGRQ